MTAPDPPLPPTASQLLRFGVAPEDVRCWACGKDWDGTTPNGLPACVACRQLAGRALRLYLDLVLTPAADTVRTA